MSPHRWLARARAIRKVAAEYGLDGDALASIGAISRSATPERALDPKWDKQNMRAGISTAFASNAALDRVTPSQTPEPGVVHRHVG